jgi:hypothetical protein
MCTPILPPDCPFPLDSPGYLRLLKSGQLGLTPKLRFRIMGHIDRRMNRQIQKLAGSRIERVGGSDFLQALVQFTRDCAEQDKRQLVALSLAL